ncbi:MAG: F0F1 ATP synthase subunit A [Clostridia bacterium]|nr:F0F1 ATP synthase subunit A [Clostridia bacterium]
MKNKSRRFVAVDILLILMMILPLVAAMVLKILFTPAGEGIRVSGAMIYYPFGEAAKEAAAKVFSADLVISEAQINSALVLLSIFGLCLYLTHGIKERPDSRRQHVAEWIVETVDNMVKGSMGERFMGFAPFIIAILGISAFSSLMALLGLYAPTSDVNIVAGWAILVFGIITYYKCQGGVGIYLKGFLDPIPIFAPFNVIGELATPVSMAFRHYGNVMSGGVIGVLVAAMLQWLSSLLLGWLPGVLGEIPFLQVGLPAILSIYFDVFSGCLQAYIFALLTMMFISGGFSLEDYEARMAKKAARREKKAAKRAAKQGK